MRVIETRRSKNRRRPGKVRVLDHASEEFRAIEAKYVPQNIDAKYSPISPANIRCGSISEQRSEGDA
jgi:hypothetical protein